MRGSVAGAIAAGLIVLTGLLAGCGTPRTDAVVLGHTGDFVTGDTVSVLVPAGRLRVTVGSALDQISSTRARDADQHDPPSGSHFVPVEVEFDPFAFSTTSRSVMSRDPKPAQLALRSGGRSLALAAPYRVASSADGIADSGTPVTYVPVADDAHDVRLAVTYDGLTQTVDLADGTRAAGVAAALYVHRPAPHPACPASGWSGAHRVSLTCSLGTLTSLPYLPGRGWAADGHTWLLVPFSASVDHVRLRGRSWDPGPVRAGLTIGGARPVSTGLFPEDAISLGRASRVFVFDAPRSAVTGTAHAVLRVALISRSADLTHGHVVLTHRLSLG